MVGFLRKTVTCPKCKKQYPKSADLCPDCNYVFWGKQRCRLAVWSFIFGLSSFFLSILTAIPALVLGIWGLFYIHSKKGEFKGKAYAICGIIFSILFLLLHTAIYFWSLDTAPIPNDYTVADLRTVDTAYDKTYIELCRLSRSTDSLDESESISSNDKDWTIIREKFNSLGGSEKYTFDIFTSEFNDVVQRIWVQTIDKYMIVDKLSREEEIVDLSPLDINMNTDFIIGMKEVLTIATCYALLNVKDGDTRQAIEIITPVYVFARKLSRTARTIHLNMACIGIFNSSIQLANHFINDETISIEDIHFLGSTFSPLRDNEFAIDNMLIYEYIVMRNYLEDIIATNGFNNQLIYKRNSTLRLARNNYDKWICRARKQKLTKNFDVWPALYFHIIPEVELDDAIFHDTLHGWLYSIYNPGGSAFLGMYIPGYGPTISYFERERVRDDLFQIVLSLRLGRPYSLKARAYSDEYVIDVPRKLIYSPGPDGQPFTKDDIKLPINPDVLGLSDESIENTN